LVGHDGNRKYVSAEENDLPSINADAFFTVFQVPEVQFAVASDSNYTFSGILGLGYTFPYSIPYPSVLNLMVAQELVGAPIFSLGLGGEMDGFSE
jgi:hypothetical protein